MNTDEIKIEIQNLTMAYGSYVVMRDINAKVKRGSVFVITEQRRPRCGRSCRIP